MIFGVQVREVLDQVSFSLAGRREEWISMIGLPFIIHRSFSWLVLVLNVWLSYKLMKIYGHAWLSTGIAVLTFGSVLSGVGMAYFAVPAFLQPVHLLISSVTFGLLLMILWIGRRIF